MEVGKQIFGKQMHAEPWETMRHRVASDLQAVPKVSPPYLVHVVGGGACSLSHIQLFCNPIDSSPPCSSVHGISLARIVAAKSLQLCPTLCDPRDGSPSGSPVPGVSRQEHWSGLPFPSPIHESEK